MSSILLDVGHTSQKWAFYPSSLNWQTTTTQVLIDDAMQTANPETDIISHIIKIIQAYKHYCDSQGKEKSIEHIYIACVRQEFLPKLTTYLKLLKAQNILTKNCAVHVLQSPKSYVIDKQTLYNNYAQPQSLGIDRWLSCLAIDGLKPKQSACIVTLGTATTLNYWHDFCFKGGLIAPGYEQMLSTLKQHKNLQQKFARNEYTTKNNFLYDDLAQHQTIHIAQTNTQQAILQGILLMQVTFIAQAYKFFLQQYFNGQAIPCIITGGYAHLLQPYLQSHIFSDENTLNYDYKIEIIEDLVIKGLARYAYYHSFN